jgi:hypothetical protein
VTGATAQNRLRGEVVVPCCEAQATTAATAAILALLPIPGLPDELAETAGGAEGVSLKLLLRADSIEQALMPRPLVARPER